MFRIFIPISICSQIRSSQTWLPAHWTDLNVGIVATFNCIHLVFRQGKEWSLNYKNIVLQAMADCAAGHWDGNLATMAYFSVLSDCGKISLLYSDIFPFFSYNEERDWWRQQQKKNNYREWESTTTQNSIMLSRRVNHFRKGSEDKPFYFNSSLGWYPPTLPLKQEGNCNTWHGLTCWAIAECSHTARSSEIKKLLI